MVAELNRRQFLQGGAAAAVGTRLGARPLIDALTAGPAACQASLTDIQHVVILIQENRSFDHYFGTYKGVRGFDDRTAPRGPDAFAQRFNQPNPPAPYPDPLLPFHIDTAVQTPPQQGMCTNDVEHQWAGQHDSWNGGRCDNWMNAHLLTDPTPQQAAMTMGYYTRSDLEFYYALADHFTICDNFHSSLIGGTDANRLYSVTGTMDPDGFDGGCQFLDTKLGTVQNPGADLGTGGRWVPYPQVLQQAGVTWKVYGTADGQAGDNVLRYFPQFRPIGGDPTLAANAFGSNAFPTDFVADCAAGTLPQVSWLMAPVLDTEHPPTPIEWGEAATHTVLSALVNSGLWKNTVLFLTYDENGGFFDHVPPPTAPPGTPGEYLNRAAMSPTAVKEATTKDGRDTSGEPIGLGFRVPMLVISPFTRNVDPAGAPLVCSDLFDHTSMLRFLETWTGALGKQARVPDRDDAAKRPGLSAWRRQLVGDLTSAFNFAAKPDASVPSDLIQMIPNRADPRVLTECIITGTPGSAAQQSQPLVQNPTIPNVTTLPAQETFSGAVLRPSGLACVAAAAANPNAGAADPAAGHAPTVSGRDLPATGGRARWMTAGGATALGAALWLRTRRTPAAEDPATETTGMPDSGRSPVA